MHHSTTVLRKGTVLLRAVLTVVVHHPVSLCKPNNTRKIFMGLYLHPKKSGRLIMWLLVCFVPSSTCGFSRRLQQYTCLHISSQPPRISQSILPRRHRVSPHRPGKCLLGRRSESGDQGTCLPFSPPKRLQPRGVAPWGFPLSRCPASWGASAQPTDRLR